jgi:hypothetical protein
METKKRFKKQKTSTAMATRELVQSTGEVQDVNALPASYVPPHEALALTQVATALFKSGMFPNVKNDAGAFAVILLGRELGIGAMTALQNVAIISGKFSCSAQLMQARAMRRGVTYKIERHDNEGCSLLISKNGHSETFSFLKADAQQAGLIRQGGMYEKYPSDMYFNRAMTRGLRKIDPECVLGLYTIDEVSDGKYSNIEEIPKAEYTDVTPKPKVEPEPPKEEPKMTDDERAEINTLYPEREIDDKLKGQIKTFDATPSLQTSNNAQLIIAKLKALPVKKADNRRTELMAQTKEDLLAKSTQLLADSFGDAIEVGDQWLAKMVTAGELKTTDLTQANKGQLVSVIIELEKRIKA